MGLVVRAVMCVALPAVVGCERPVEEVRSPSGDIVLETWCRSPDSCTESAEARCPEGVEIVGSSTDDDEGVCRVRFRCIRGAKAGPLSCPSPVRRENVGLRTVERTRTLGLELDGGFGAAPGTRYHGGLFAGALELAAVYRIDSAFAVALDLGLWKTSGGCTLSAGNDGACDFPLLVRAASEARWYFVHTTNIDATLLGEAGAFLARGYDPAPLLGGGARFDLVLGPVLLGAEIRGGPALSTPKPTPYFLTALSLGMRIRLGE